jgi:hypothetical protein
MLALRGGVGDRQCGCDNFTNLALTAAAVFLIEAALHGHTRSGTLVLISRSVRRGVTRARFPFAQVQFARYDLTAADGVP